ncbi:uncharacterized protein LOC17893546 isoform X1 [Capsella rubella]|uniref:uncharacterized protein LOC17893546 isoform X1 n=1 Tax=Capsella rubella TaxID=81985 RepID=UPI000CD4F363|nr:uncharacterized protein LOC17893546 isoform X1 [Capsella rubella]
MKNENAAATPEYAIAKIMVWWDMKDCPIPGGYNARRFRRSIEGAFNNLGYSGPVSITAYGDQTQTPDHLLHALSSTGIAIAHARSESTASLMYSDMVKWRGHNPPPATMMFISDQVDYVFSLDLIRLQQKTLYNLFLGYSVRSKAIAELLTSAEWRWEKLLWSTPVVNKHEEIISAMFYCKSCQFDCQSLEIFRNHLSSSKHAWQEVRKPTARQLAPVTRKWGRNYPAKPEYATAKIVVWWDMVDCPIPESFDATRVRPSLEGAFKNLGYSGPVSITAYGDQSQTPDHLLRGLSSTGIAVSHANSHRRLMRMISDLHTWLIKNPPPATIMLILDDVDDVFSNFVSGFQQKKKNNIFLAYPYRRYKMSAVVTSAEWLWESLLAVSETRRHVLQRCSQRGESTQMFDCKTCCFDCNSLDHFRKHLSSRKHKWGEYRIHADVLASKYDLERIRLGRELMEEDFEMNERVGKHLKRSRKTFRTGFRPFHDHLHLINRRA